MRDPAWLARVNEPLSVGDLQRLRQSAERGRPFGDDAPSDPIDEEEPFEFTVKAGPKRLSLLVEASKPGALLQVIEDCGSGNRRIVDTFFFESGNPGRGYVVRGVSS